jgi:thioredoxin:protein disulfide reductase
VFKPRHLIGLLLLGGVLFGQTSNVLTIAPPAKLRVKRGETATAVVRAELKPGYHTNSNTPSDPYLIPLRLTWQPAPLQVAEVTYPKPKMEKFEFSEKPLSVFDGAFDITTKFKVPAAAPNGMAMISGKLRYQACNDRMCLPPKTVEVTLTLDIQ